MNAGGLSAAFLRGVNLGGRTVTGPQLVDAFDRMGFRDARSFIASGNVVFRCPRGDSGSLRAKLNQGLSKALGFGVVTFVRSLVELAKLAEMNPFELNARQAKEFNVNVTFFNEPLAAGTRKSVLALANGYDDFHVQRRELFWLCRGKITDSQLFRGALSKVIGNEHTMRNHRTIVRLVEKFG